MPNHHIVMRQFLQVELIGSEAEGMSLQRNLPELCRHGLTPAIEKALNNCAPSHGNLYVERLEIDVGNLNLENFEYDLPFVVAAAIEKQLRELMPSVELSGQSFSTDIQHRSEQQSVQEAFIYFLGAGSLPWWFHLQPDQSLEQAILASWHDADESGIPSAHFSLVILDALLDVSARIRLTHQFTPIFLEKLLLKLAPSQMKVVAEVLQTLNSTKLADIERRVFTQQIWQTVFLDAAQGKLHTPVALVVNVMKILQEKNVHIPALANFLKQLYSGTKDGSVGIDSNINTSQRIDNNEYFCENKDSVVASGLTDPDDISRLFKDAQPKNNDQVSPDHASLSNHHGDTDTSVSTALSMSNDGIDNSLDNISVEKKKVLQHTEKIKKESISNDIDQLNNSNSSSATDEIKSRDVEPDGQNKPVKTEEAQFKTEVIQNENIRTDNIRNGNIAHNMDRLESLQKNSRSDSAKNKIKLGNLEADGYNKAVHSEKSFIRIDIKEGVYINCAGIILLHPFLPRFFESLGISSEDQLLQPERALCLLHYLATGQTIAPEYELVLPKLLCNVPLEHPAEANVNLTQAELDESAALLDAVVGHWSVLQNTSAESLRGTFLVRPGKLSVRGDGDWLLQVENRTFDILLDQLPWGFGMIKLPWMDKMLWVEWR